MLQKARAHMTYANVMATIAVFGVLGGTAYAALAKNSVGSKQLKTNAVKTVDLANDAVTTEKVANGTLLSEDFASGQLPAGAQGPQGPQGPKGDQGDQGIQGIQGNQGVPGTPAAKRWAVIPASGAVITRSSDPAITETHSNGTGRYVVDFATNVSNCAWIATVGPDQVTPITGDIAVGNDTGDPEKVVVFTDNNAGGGADKAFHIAVFC